jgi:hypothetical protein
MVRWGRFVASFSAAIFIFCGFGVFWGLREPIYTVEDNLFFVNLLTPYIELLIDYLCIRLPYRALDHWVVSQLYKDMDVFSRYTNQARIALEKKKNPNYEEYY